MNTNVLILAVTLLTSTYTFSQNPNFHIYLCFGQSNMEGSAAIEPQDTIGDERFLVLQSLDCPSMGYDKNKWRKAIPPLCQCNTGLSPADYFGRTMVANLPDSIRVGVVHVAVGGSDIRLFDKELYQDYDSTYQEQWFYDKVRDYGGNPYEHLINLAKSAQKDGVIKGILLHQGETNTGDSQWPEYLKTVYTNILNDLSLEAEYVPLLAGELVNEDEGGICASMNSIIRKLPGTIPTAHVVSSERCASQTDSVHFNSEGVRKLGKRYAFEMLSLQGVEVSEP